MLLENKSLFPFDRQYPIYNFFYPNSGSKISHEEAKIKFQIANEVSKKRALYFHIPFCETICSFCPFTRGLVKDSEAIEIYVSALINEIKLKASHFNIGGTPINSIFFGGGTPSMLSEKNIRDLGEVIHDCFDLSELKEFSFEIEVKSITDEKVQALKDIGVTHPRFGLQSFSKKWRDFFTLTASLEQVYSAIELLNSNFQNVSFDILYGMSGQDEAELLRDLKLACDTNCTNIDIYPIDNVMTQTTLHRSLTEAGYKPTTAVRKFTMNLLVDEYMRSRGYIPHNGHGYRKINKYDRDIIVYPDYSFEYHNHVYGYHDYDLVGFGVNAISSLYGLTLINPTSRKKYIDAYTHKNHFNFLAKSHNPILDYARPLILRLPYHGEVEKKRINFEEIPCELLEKIHKIEDYGLIIESDSEYRVTKKGWYNYVNIMYYLMPQFEKISNDNMVSNQLENPNRLITTQEILFMDEYYD